jgi:hypothetical protein
VSSAAPGVQRRRARSGKAGTEQNGCKSCAAPRTTFTAPGRVTKRATPPTTDRPSSAVSGSGVAVAGPTGQESPVRTTGPYSNVTRGRASWHILPHQSGAGRSGSGDRAPGSGLPRVGRAERLYPLKGGRASTEPRAVHYLQKPLESRRKVRRDSWQCNGIDQGSVVQPCWCGHAVWVQTIRRVNFHNF